MAGCLEGLQLPRIEWFELSEKRNAVASIVAGTLVRRILFNKGVILRILSRQSMNGQFWFVKILDLKENANFFILCIPSQFFVGWWLIIDISAYYGLNFALHICGIFGTISLFM